MSLQQVIGASIVSPGSGGSNGTQTVTVASGNVGGGGSPAQLSVTISGGAMTAVLSVVNPGTYQGLGPQDPVPVTGAGLVGGTLALSFNAGDNGAADFLL